MLELIQGLVDFILHIDQHLVKLAADLGAWLYVVLFGIVFCETGLVILPLLPGDSLLFATGTLIAAPGSPLELPFTLALLITAAILGDAVNYAIGAYLGPQVFTERSRLLNPKYVLRTEAFYAKYGKKTIFLARFVPIVRTFAPFLAGIGHAVPRIRRLQRHRRNRVGLAVHPRRLLLRPHPVRAAQLQQRDPRHRRGVRAADRVRAGEGEAGRAAQRGGVNVSAPCTGTSPRS